MAIKPEECVKIMEDEKKVVADLEKSIDIILRQEFTHYDASVTFALPKAPTPRVLESLKSLYTAVGWAVTYHSTSESNKPVLVFRRALRAVSYGDKD